MNSLAEYTKDQLIAELINRPTFSGVVVYLEADARPGTAGPLAFDSQQTKITKSPPLSPEAVESLLRTGIQMIPRLFGGQS